MNSKISAFLGFITGAAVGGAVVWYYTKDKYAKLAQEEIDSVKETYAHREQRKEEPDQSQDEPSTVLVNGRMQDKGDIAAYARKVQEAGYTDYSTTVVPPKAKAVEPEKRDLPYVIAPYEFGELDGYAKVSLTYFADGILADEYGEEVDDAEEIVGDALSHFGEYEDDSVYVRNDAKRCDYEILKSLDTLEEFLSTHQPEKEG